LTDRRLAGWVARDLETHLDELADAARKWRDGAGERPVITVHLTSGQRHIGHVLERMRGTLVLQGLPQRGTIDLDVTVIPIARIEALTFHGAQGLVSAPVPADIAESSLDLKRRAKALSDLLTSRVGSPISVDIGAGELAQVAPSFELVKVALERVCSDDIGRSSLAERVKRIEVRGGAAARVSLASGLLVVEGLLSSVRLQSELDALL